MKGEIITNFGSSYEAKLNKDFLNFKEMFLKRLDDYNFQLEETQGKINSAFESKFYNYDIKEEELKALVKHVNEELIVEKLKHEKYNSLLHFQPIAEEEIISFKKKLINLTTDLKISTDRYDKAILENLDVPGIVGHACPNKNLKQYIERNEIKMSDIDVFKDLVDTELRNMKISFEVGLKNIRKVIFNIFLYRVLLIT